MNSVCFIGMEHEPAADAEDELGRYVAAVIPVPRPAPNALRQGGSGDGAKAPLLTLAVRHGPRMSRVLVIRTQVQPVSLHTRLSPEPASARL